MHTITYGASTIIPDSIEVFENEYVSGNLIHTILGREEPDVSFRPATLSTGSLTLGFNSSSDASEALTAHRTGQVFTLASTSRPELDMSYVTNGRIVRALSPVTLNYWRIVVDFQQVTP